MSFEKDSRREEGTAMAVEVLRERFSKGLAEICDPRFLSRRYDDFLRRNDPIYVELLQGMDDRPLSKTFVSYWTIAHTLATKSRFWLEDSVAEIIHRQVKQFGREATHVYSLAMLGKGFFEDNRTVADIGEQELEHLTVRKPWRPPMKENALRQADLIVGEQERERITKEDRRKPFQPRGWDQVDNHELISRDRDHLERIARSVDGLDVSDVAIRCNLLVVEPERSDGQPHVYAFRFINPKTISSHAERKQERVNLLRLYGFLVQEKVFRKPSAIRVAVAELLPRKEGGFEHYDYYPDYFSSHTYWPSEKLWEFIGVPFEAVTNALKDVAGQFKQQLTDGLRCLLPGAETPADWGKKRIR